jgi:hypothetical protein
MVLSRDAVPELDIKVHEDIVRAELHRQGRTNRADTWVARYDPADVCDDRRTGTLSQQ